MTDQKISFPKISITKAPATLSVLNVPQRMLFVGQKVAAGTATTGQLYTEIANDNSWDTLFGANSMIAGMIRSARAINQQTRFDAIPLDDNGAAVAATGTVAFSGTASEDGTITINIGSREDYSFTIAVSDLDTADVVGTALETAVNANTEIPITASNSTGTVTLTADNKGTELNGVGLEYSGSVVGITVVLTGFASGATDPVLTSIFDVLGDERYQTIVFPYGYGTDFVTDFLDPRWNSDNIILDGIGVTSFTDTLSNIKTAVNLLNSQSLAIQANKQEIALTSYKGSALFELDYIIAAQAGATRALRLTTGSNISRFVISTAVNDLIGGPSIATLPYANTSFFNLPLIDEDKGFSQTEIEELVTAGAFVIGNNQGRTASLFGEVVTTYKTDGASNPDVSFKYTNYVDTISSIAEYLFNNLKSDFGQSRLTLGDLRAGYNMANEASIRARLAKYYIDLTGDVYLLTQSGEDAIQFFKNNLSISIDLANGKVTIECQTPIVTQLREVVATIKVAFSTT